MSGAARDLARAGLVVTGALFVSRILGWIRVAVIAASLGIGRELDIYTAAFRLPDFLFQLVAAGALASAVIPTIASLVEAGDRARAWRVVSTVANLLLVILAALAALTFVAAPQLAPLVAPGFDAAETEALVELTRILLLSPIFLALSAVATSILNSAGRFSASVVAPIVYNLVIIAAAVFVVPSLRPRRPGLGNRRRGGRDRARPARARVPAIRLRVLAAGRPRRRGGPSNLRPARAPGARPGRQPAHAPRPDEPGLDAGSRRHRRLRPRLRRSSRSPSARSRTLWASSPCRRCRSAWRRAGSTSTSPS